MRDQQLVLPFGSLPVRKFFVSIAAILVATFAYIFFLAPTAQAQTPAGASWNGASITYNQHQYVAIADAKAGDSHNIPVGSKIYAYVEPTTSSPSNPTKKAHLIYFAPGVDPGTATSANLVTYDLTGTTYTNPSGASTIAITPQSGTTDTATTCNVSGVGWIVCPVSNFLAKAMDWLFGVLANFLTVRPLQSNQDNALFRAWSVMRNFANVAFVMGFLVIIYSQLSNLGLSSYGIKKMLPRLIIAAILVNVSYWICTVAIDASNILGYSIQDVLINIRDDVKGTNPGASDIDFGWETLTGAVLAGGALGAAGVIKLVSIGSLSGAIYMLLPVLIFVIIAALVAILIMAVRQAIIIVLVIIAPLAFVAFLLPNTEKYFERWRGLFMTMLLLFPIFAVIFGGSQIAGTAIIQNADTIIMLILGMATQIAPLVVLPFLIKFSGGLIGQIAGIANNKSKGLIDRTRQFSQEKADLRKSQVLARPKARWYKRPLSAMVQGADNGRRSRETQQKTNETLADANWIKHKNYQKYHNASEEATMLKETGEVTAQAAANRLKTVDGHRMQIGDVNLRIAKLDVDDSKVQGDVQWENLRAAPSALNVIPAQLAAQALRARTQTEEASVAARQLHSAQHMQAHEFAEALEASPALRQRAGGIDPSGAIKAEATAMGEILKASEADVTAGVQLLNFRALRSNTTLKELSGSIVRDVADGRGTYSTGEVEAALEAQAQDGQMVVFEEARMSPNVDQDIVSRVIARNAPTFKSKGGFHLQADPGLANAPINVMNAARAGSLGDTSADSMKDLKFGWIQGVARNIDGIIRDSDPRDLEKAYTNVYEALTNDRIRATIGDRLDEVQAIELALRNQGYHAKPPTL